MNSVAKTETEMIVQALRAVGINVTMVSDLLKVSTPYREGIPILLKYLPIVNDLGVKEAIVRALTVKEARGVANGALIAEFRAIPADEKTNLGIRWAIANALSVVATDAVFDDLVELLRDKRNGRAREMLAVALGNMKNPRAVDVLIELLNDDEVAGHAIMALGKLKAQKARPYIERFLNHPKAWVRREAQKALAKLDKQRSTPGKG